MAHVDEPQVYTNAMQFGDVAHVHRDSNRHECVTALLYPNEAWDPSLAGETCFYAEDEAVRLAVLPRPGRLVLFVSSMQHVGRPPSRLFWGQRLTLAIKFVPER
jgi:SM-20-related protein